MELTTPRLRLRLQTLDEVLAWIDAMSPDDRAAVSPAWISQAKAATPGDPWAFSFTVFDRGSGSSIGGCSFKGPPNADGIVEIAYGIDPQHQNRGYATEAAKALIDFALSDARVRQVIAHTMPDNAISSRVLEKCGFRRIGEIFDPEDGLVSRWTRENEAI
ncbi:GNAT family N-acetyltransferase [Arenimonas sp.]|uniref:GNAT family N-acetyltransferase n=1 Tax=Arenimonas sp. TaxID=1872635 RepID=UPI0039E3B3CA